MDKQLVIGAFVVIAILLVAAGQYMPQKEFTPKGFDVSLETGTTNVATDVVLTFTKAMTEQPESLMPVFQNAVFENVKIYRYNYRSNAWELWYNTEFAAMGNLPKNVDLTELDPCTYAKWDGNAWEVKLLIAKADTFKTARFTYSSADMASASSTGTSCWTASEKVCTWQGNVLKYSDSFCADGQPEDGYLWVCYAGDPGTNQYGFKARQCGSGCIQDSPLGSAHPRAFCITSPESCYNFVSGADITESIDATNCASRGGQWNWCNHICENPETCYDGTLNQNEVGVDCGGVCAASCPPVNIREPTCYDGIQNQAEFGIDCGGPCDSCVTYPTTPTCYDHVKNQGESSIDCGGPCAECVPPRVSAATIPNQHDCVYRSLPTLTLSATEPCPPEFVCPLTGNGFLHQEEAISDCGGTTPNTAVQAPTILTSYARDVYRDASGNPICPGGGAPQFYEDVNNACSPTTSAAIWFVIIIAAGAYLLRDKIKIEKK